MLIEEEWLNPSNLNLMVVLKVVEVVAVDLSLTTLTVASIEARSLTTLLLTTGRQTSLDCTDPIPTMIDLLTTRLTILSHRARSEPQKFELDWLGH